MTPRHAPARERLVWLSALALMMVAVLMYRLHCRPVVDEMSPLVVTVSGTGASPTPPLEPSLVPSEIAADGSEGHTAIMPNSFDVLTDAIVLNDPINSRAVVLDHDGRTQRSIELPFPAARIKAYAGVSFRAMADYVPSERDVDCSLTTGACEAATSPPAPKTDFVVAQTPAGLVLSAESTRHQTSLEPDESTECALGASVVADEDGVWTVTDIGNRRSGEYVRTELRKYDLLGKLRWRLAEAPAQSVLTPDDEYRARGGVLFQIVPSKSQIVIHRWGER